MGQRGYRRGSQLGGGVSKLGKDNYIPRRGHTTAAKSGREEGLKLWMHTDETFVRAQRREERERVGMEDGAIILPNMVGAVYLYLSNKSSSFSSKLS